MNTYKLFIYLTLTYFCCTVSNLHGSAYVTAADEVTPEISALAHGLEHDPVKIFNYVRNEIDFVPYWGVKKGATLCLLERSGNSFDQCTLLVALLKASGFNPLYKYGRIDIPVDDPSGNDLKTWFGVDNALSAENLVYLSSNPGRIDTGVSGWSDSSIVKYRKV